MKYFIGVHKNGKKVIALMLPSIVNLVSHWTRPRSRLKTQQQHTSR